MMVRARRDRTLKRLAKKGVPGCNVKAWPLDEEEIIKLDLTLLRNKRNYHDFYNFLR